MYVLTILFADDLIIIQKNENDLQKAMFVLNEQCRNYDFQISKTKTKIMPFKGKHPVRSKIILEGQSRERY